MDYAFRVFCAVWGYRVASSDAAGPLLRIGYGRNGGGGVSLSLPAGYRFRPVDQPAAAPGWLGDGQQRMPCFHFAADGQPDWLGEIFEWLSGADEQACVERDAVGRVPLSATLHGRYGLEPLVPYAARAMQRLNDQLRGTLGDAWLARPARPWQGADACRMAATHDVDFLPVSRRDAARRWFKNLAISLVHFRDPRLALGILAAGLRGAVGIRPVLDCLPAMLRREQAAGIKSTCNILCHRNHRRDANYVVEDQRVADYLHLLSRQGCELGVHGSYTSLDVPGGLAAEYRRLESMGFNPAGGRQHWLRYADARLFDELQAAGACYDTTVGYAMAAGFRAGACFPYPPYDFKNEAPYRLLELPLVLMDVTLYGESRRRASWRQRGEQVLKAVRDHGWGGVSILWHDTVFHGGQIPQPIGDLYWELKAANERWTSALELVETVWPRYADAGLLPQRSGASLAA